MPIHGSVKYEQAKMITGWKRRLIIGTVIVILSIGHYVAGLWYASHVFKSKHTQHNELTEKEVAEIF